ncbi:MAG: ketoacyl-ACP synthase III [Selenomonas sp.]|uniref:3-oxoacyl-ACP synthase III family protein n=1 Tax=Selenomonas sp. TaxID=2053611 RepID=UPI0025FD1347|nr:ketoacyl-ACP synthase III [Selenomonas sp.]MCR5439591.1 ketoacyl-ACP synthase III [Selenomonas sp.]
MIVKVDPFRISMVAGVVSNITVPVEEYCQGLGTEKKIKRLIRETGFQKLSVAEKGVCASDMCFQAAEKVLESSQVDKDSIGALIFVSQTPDYRAPSTAYVLQKRLGLANSLVAFDINLGCSGFVYGLYVCAMILATMSHKKALLCCGDVCSSAMNPNSPGKRAITGDAGTCVLVEPVKEKKESVYFNIDSYGDRFNALYVPNGSSRHPFTLKNNKIDTDNQNNFSVMDGLAILDFTMNEVCDNINRLFDHYKIISAEIDAALLHQPNLILVKAIQEKLGFSDKQLVCNSQDIGNTSSASIPLLLTEIGEAWQERGNSLSLLSGFGIGLSVSSVLMDLQNTVCLKTMKYDNRYTFMTREVGGYSYD